MGQRLPATVRNDDALGSKLNSLLLVSDHLFSIPIYPPHGGVVPLGGHDDLARVQQLNRHDPVRREEDLLLLGDPDVVQDLVPAVVQEHANYGEWDHILAEFHHKFVDWSHLEEVTENIDSDLFLARALGLN